MPYEGMGTYVGDREHALGLLREHEGGFVLLLRREEDFHATYGVPGGEEEVAWTFSNMHELLRVVEEQVLANVRRLAEEVVE